jgi:hypothetical protein
MAAAMPQPFCLARLGCVVVPGAMQHVTERGNGTRPLRATSGIPGLSAKRRLKARKRGPKLRASGNANDDDRFDARSP